MEVKLIILLLQVPHRMKSIDHVENYEDFMNQLKKDDKFEKMIQSMTTDRLAGGSKLAKNKFNW